MGLGGVAIAVLPSVVHPKRSFSDRLGGNLSNFVSNYNSKQHNSKPQNKKSKIIIKHQYGFLKNLYLKTNYSSAQANQ